MPPGVAGAGGSGVIIDPPFPLPPIDPGEFFSTTLSSESDPLATTLEATIPVGQFQITLFDGWFLEKVVDGEAVEIVAVVGHPLVQERAVGVEDLYPDRRIVGAIDAAFAIDRYVAVVPEPAGSVSFPADLQFFGQRRCFDSFRTGLCFGR